MKNIALKFAKETSFTSVKVQQLMDQEQFPDEEFENQKKYSKKEVKSNL